MPATSETRAIFGLIADAIQWTPEKRNAESWQSMREVLKQARDGATLLEIRGALLFRGWAPAPPPLKDE